MRFLLAFIAFNQQDRMAQMDTPGGCANLLPGIKSRDRESYLMAEELNKRARFEQVVLPHMDAAYNLARWLTRNDHDAQDVAPKPTCARTGSSTAFAAATAAPGC